MLLLLMLLLLMLLLLMLLLLMLLLLMLQTQASAGVQSLWQSTFQQAKTGRHCVSCKQQSMHDSTH